MERPDWAPRDVDIKKASAARLYDYFLGGSYNFEVDRALGRQIEQAAPGVPEFAFLNRAWPVNDRPGSESRAATV